MSTPGRLKTIALRAAGGEYEAVQLVLRPLSDGRLASATVSSWRNSQGIEAPLQVTLNEVGYVYVAHPQTSK